MFKTQLSQFFPPTPSFTEADVPSQKGRVFIVTGGASGIGLELCKTLYQKGGRVYIAGRSEEKATEAIRDIQAALPAPDDGASLQFLHLDLANLSTIKASVSSFKAKESRLDVLWNNAGVSQPPLGSVSKQGFELQLATNCLGPFLFTQLLLPLLNTTAASSSSSSDNPPPGAVRVVWTASQMIELAAPTGGIILSELHHPPKDITRAYVNSKTANYFLSAELARQQQQNTNLDTQVISVCTNPGAASTPLFRHTPWTGFLARPLLYPAKMAALTQLYAGLSGDITAEKNGCYVVPWGRVTETVREDLLEGAGLEEEGGTGRAREVWGYFEVLTRVYR